MSKARIVIVAAFIATSLTVPALQAVSGATDRQSGTNLAVSAIQCSAIIGLDNSTYVNYNTYASASSSVAISVWFGTDPSSDVNYTNLFKFNAFAVGATVNQTNYPSQLTSFPLYFETCIRNNSGGTVANWSICGSNQTSCP